MKEEYSVLKNIPNELKSEALWCCWKYIPNIDKITGKQVVDKNGVLEYIKKPFNVIGGYGAKSNDEKTFNSYPTCLNYLHRYYKIDEETGKQLGGLGLGIFRGFSAIDIDHCIDKNGKLSDMAQDIVDYCQSYTEYSPSKTGIRIIFKTDKKIDKNHFYINNSKKGLEVYISNNTNKFVTITGNRLGDCDIVNMVDIEYILNKYMKREQIITSVPTVNFNREVNISLEQALTKDSKLYQLWNNAAPGSHSNESELDMSLCCKLAFYLNNDKYAIKSAFESSPYYMSKDDMHKNKWERGYGENTVNMAINYTYSNPIVKTEVIQPVEVHKSYGLNDVGNSHRFADKFQDNIHYNFENEMWMLWNGKYWEYDIKDKIRDYVDILAKDMMKDLRDEDNEATRKIIAQNINHIQNSSGKKSLLEECQHIGNIPVLNSDFDNDKYLICAPNMVYDLEHSTILPHKKEYMMSQCLSCDIDLENEPKRWIQFLNEIFDNDQEMINYNRKVWAYCMSGSTREQAMWIYYGDGNNGKSLALEILNEIMGSYGNTSRPELLVDSKNGNTSQEEVARLKGKRTIFMEEIKDGDRMNESLVKQLTSGVGKMTGRFLYGNTFELTVIGKILMASNYKPKVKGIDKGIWRRIKLVPLYRDFTATLDKDLRDKLIAELPQIAGWLVKGFKLYLEEGLKEPLKVKNETKEYREESDIVQTWINENCELGEPSTHWSKASELFEDFVFWCKKNQENILTQTAFGRNMGKKFKRLSYSTGKVYVGIKLRLVPVDVRRKVMFDTIEINKDEI